MTHGVTSDLLGLVRPAQGAMRKAVERKTDRTEREAAGLREEERQQEAKRALDR